MLVKENVFYNYCALPTTENSEQIVFGNLWYKLGMKMILYNDT